MIVPGRPLFYATAMPQGGFGHPFLAENHMGRPTKLEGNPDHPASLGATDLFGQTSVLDLYDPDRSRTILHRGEVTTWNAFLGAVAAIANAQRPLNGQSLRILTGPITSPSLAAQMKALQENFPEAKWHQWDAVYGASQDGAPAAAAVYRFDKADVVLSLDADFLGFGPGAVRYAKDFSSRRRMGTVEHEVNRLYVVEPVPTVTGANADHRLSLKARDVHAFAAAVAAGVGAAGAAAGTLSAAAQKWASEVAADLQAHKGRSAVVAGPHQPAAVHAVARAINDALGNTGTSVIYTAPICASPADGTASLKELVGEMNAGKVDALFILGGNPVFTAPADLKFVEALGKVENRIHLGLYVDETAEQCHWHIPEAHYLESWGDVRSVRRHGVADSAADRTNLRRPQCHRGAGGVERRARSVPDGSRSRSTGRRSSGERRGLRNRTGQAFPSADSFWRNALHDGFLHGTSILGGAAPTAAPAASAAPAPAAKTGLEIIFRPDPHVLDGRFANNAWLQELPKPLSKVTWDNVAYISPKTAEAHGIPVFRVGNDDQQMLTVSYQGRTFDAPVWVLPGTADDVVVVHFGYGRTRAGRIGNGVGDDTPSRCGRARRHGSTAARRSSWPAARMPWHPRRTTSRWKAVTRCAWPSSRNTARIRRRSSRNRDRISSSTRR